MLVNKRLGKVEKISSQAMELKFQGGNTTTPIIVVALDAIHIVVRYHQCLKDDPNSLALKV